MNMKKCIVLCAITTILILSACSKESNKSPYNNNPIINLFGSNGDTLTIDSGIRSQQNGTISYRGNSYRWTAIGEPGDAITINTGTLSINGSVYIYTDTLIVTVSYSYGAYMPFKSLMYKSYH